MKDRSTNWVINLSSIEDFEVSNRALNNLIWRKQRAILIITVLVMSFFIWNIFAMHHGIIRFQTEGRQRRELIWSIVLIICGINILGTALWQWIKTFKHRKILFLSYPELDNELANLKEAEYIDEELQAYVYGHHLVVISAGHGLSVIDLYRCILLETTTKAVNDSTYAHHIIATLDDGKSLKILIPNFDIEIQQNLEELIDYFNTYYFEK